MKSLRLAGRLSDSSDSSTPPSPITLFAVFAVLTFGIGIAFVGSKA